MSYYECEDGEKGKTRQGGQSEQVAQELRYQGHHNVDMRITKREENQCEICGWLAIKVEKSGRHG